jgi:branched-chain amino acid transport system ATP-binding protein
LNSVILETRGLSKAFGGLIALDSVDLSVEAGKISAVIGPNGAGKTTLFNLITGVYAPTSGQVMLGGRPLNRRPSSGRQRIMATLGQLTVSVLDGLLMGSLRPRLPFLASLDMMVPAHERAKLGIVRTYQHVHLFGNMTVLENVMTGQHPRSRYGFLEAALRLPRAHREEEAINLKATKYLNLVGLGEYASQNALGLPLGQQKLLAIGRALATEPQLLLLDEPGAGLNTLEKQELADLIRRIRELGVTVLLVEHDMPLVMGLAEWVTVLDSGQKIAEGTAAQVQKDRRVISAYLGEEVE